MLKKRLDYYFDESQKHIIKIQKANEVLEEVMPIDITILERYFDEITKERNSSN